jgi:ribosome-binding ATPase YchF (GTP1/OBG family)
VLRCKTALEEGKPLRALALSGDDRKRLSGFQFLSAKPLLLVINLDESDVGDVGADVEKAATATGLTGFLAHAETKAVALCTKIELEISQLDDADREMFLNELGLSESGLDRVIRTAYDLLGYMSFFTVGEDECRAWSIHRGTQHSSLPAKFTAISSADLSAPRSSRMSR